MCEWVDLVSLNSTHIIAALRLLIDPPLDVEVISEFQEFQEFKTTQSIFKR